MPKHSKSACTGTTKNGKPCKANPLKGTERCRRHPASDTSDTASRARTEDWSREAFLAAFEESGMVIEACEMVGIARSTAYLERQRNEDFAIAWADVEERSTERMEREAYRRAVEGTVEPVVSAGKHVTDVRRYSDSLLQFMLKARRPDRYRENVKVEHGGTIHQEVRVDLAKLPDEDLDALERILDKAAA